MNIPGLNQMDAESRTQAVQAYLVGEVEKLEKVLEGINVVLANLDKRLKDLEAARITQIALNGEISAKLDNVPVKSEKPLESPNYAKKWPLANLFNSILRRK